MRQRFLVSKIISITLHRKTKSFSKNVISCSRSFFCSFYIQLVGFITYCLPKIRVCLEPHFRITNFVNGIQLIPPNGYMGIDVISLKYVHQLHFDCIAASITNSTLRADRNNDVVVYLRCTLFNSADNILSDVAGKPFVYGRNLNL